MYVCMYCILSDVFSTFLERYKLFLLKVDLYGFYKECHMQNVKKLFT